MDSYDGNYCIHPKYLQWRIRSDAALWGIWWGYRLFSTHPAVFSHISRCSKIDLSKMFDMHGTNIWRESSVPNFCSVVDFFFITFIMIGDIDQIIFMQGDITSVICVSQINIICHWYSLCITWVIYACKLVCSDAVYHLYPSYSDTLTLVLLNLDISCLSKQCRSRSVGLKKPTDLDLHFLPLSIWIYSHNLDQVIWLAKN